jgi:hypothetical protein
MDTKIRISLRADAIETDCMLGLWSRLASLAPLWESVPALWITSGKLGLTRES